MLPSAQRNLITKETLPKQISLRTPAFPKLIYVLEEDNVREGTKYWYLTKMAE